MKKLKILNKCAAESFRFVKVRVTFYWTPGVKGLKK